MESYFRCIERKLLPTQNSISRENIYFQNEGEIDLKQADAQTDCYHKTLTTGISQNILQPEGKVILEVYVFNLLCHLLQLFTHTHFKNSLLFCEN